MADSAGSIPCKQIDAICRHQAEKPQDLPPEGGSHLVSGLDS